MRLIHFNVLIFLAIFDYKLYGVAINAYSEHELDESSAEIVPSDVQSGYTEESDDDSLGNDQSGEGIDLEKYEDEPEYDDVETKRQNCKKGGYFKPDRCNTCYCLDDKGHTMCTQVMCKKTKKLVHVSKNQPMYKKLSAAADKCVPPAVVSIAGCNCTCQIPSVIVCSVTCFNRT